MLPRSRSRGAAGAQFVRDFGCALVAGQALGHGPGEAKEPWSLTFQRVAAPIYRETIPSDSLEEIREAFVESATVLSCTASPRELATDWPIVEQFLRTAAKAIAEACSVSPVDREQQGALSLSGVVAVLRVDALASLIAAPAAERLQKAGERVWSCLAQQPSPLGDSEVRWVKLLAGGIRVADLAEAEGYSERQMYRNLAEVWRALGVSSRVEGVSLAVENGWVVTEG